MTMNFTIVKNAIINSLGESAGGRYRVSGYRPQNHTQEQVSGSRRMVQVVYASGEFPKSASGYGPFTHDVTLNIVLFVSEPSSVDLSVINDPGASSGERKAALDSMVNAAESADSSMDELFGLVFSDIMKGENWDLCEVPVYNRWVSGFEKHQINPNGEYAELVGIITVTFRVEENVDGAVKSELLAVGGTIDIPCSEVSNIEIEIDLDE